MFHNMVYRLIGVGGVKVSMVAFKATDPWFDFWLTQVFFQGRLGFISSIILSVMSVYSIIGWLCMMEEGAAVPPS